MQNSNSTIYFNFSYFALRLLGKNLYSNHWSAISELVANGLDAGAKNVKIYFNLKDKGHATIEILDNGNGMDYDDLAGKYVLIGKDKRDDGQLDEETKKQFMGRKGIGKLAALFLSSKYYLISKTVDQQSAWCLDALNVKQSDIPHLDKIKLSSISIETEMEWNEFSTGTLIKLTNVDLTNFGEKTLEAFKARLADFYLLDKLRGRIEVGVRTGNEEKIVFDEVKKSIAFKNMCVFYYNTSYDFSQKLGKNVYFKSSVESIKHRLKPVEIVNPYNFTVKGKKKFLKENGKYTETELEYEMKGWIGLHTSIAKADAVKNDNEYLKNKAYSPNRLRLYVRKKLAVENFLEYVKNHQAFNNYIEGEISFDILDDNELGDIATSNRQGFVEDDERVRLLIEILQPIIGYLIRTRVKRGQEVRKEDEEYFNKIKREQEAKREEEERKRIEAENARFAAEKDKREAQKQVSVLNQELKTISVDLGSEKKRNYFLLDALSEDQVDYAKRLHMVKINVGTIEKVITKLVMKIQRKKFREEDAWESLKTISYCTGRINAILQYGAVASFDTKEESTTGNLFQYISEYVEKIIHNDNIKIEVLIEEGARFMKRFSTQDIAVILENIVSNSLKHNAKLLTIHMYATKHYYAIDFTDNGDGLNNKITNSEELFEFGKGYTNAGTGVGLYHVREIVQALDGNVSIKKVDKGFELQMRYVR
jgi:signal transduction histidine kinase